MTHRTLLRGAYIISMDPAIGEIDGGDVLVEDGALVHVGEQIEAEVDARTIDLQRRIMIPGLIDGHRHTWEALLRHVSADWTFGNYYQGLRVALARHYTPEDSYVANAIGILDALDSGVTTTLDWSHNLNSPEHSDATIEANLDSGARVVFGYGNSNDEWLPVSSVPHSRDAVRIRDQYFPSADGRVTMQLGPRGPEYTTLDVTKHDISLARELGLRMSISVGDGVWGKDGPVRLMHDEGLTGPDIGYVHCTMLSDDELRIIAETGGAAVISPDIEAQMWGHSATRRLIESGLLPSLSVDCVTSISGDMFGVMRTTAVLQRALDHQKAERDGETMMSLGLTVEEILEMATIAGARFCGLEDRIGSLTPGKRADIVTIRTDTVNMAPMNNPVGAVVLSTQRGDVDMVMVDGEILKQNGVLLRSDITTLVGRAEESRNRVMSDAGVPLKSNWIPDNYEVR